jgi:sec-independent protein translocase protein TatA
MTRIAAMGIGWAQMLVVAFVALLLFGHRLPSAMKSLGRGIREFQDGMKSTGDELTEDETDRPQIDRKSSSESAKASVNEKSETTA